MQDTQIEKYARDVELEKPTERTAIEVKNLIVGATSQRTFVIGDTESLARIATNEPVKSVFWNEDAICIVMADRSQMIKFEPELNPVVESFFQRADKKTRRDADDGLVQAWEGDYEPLQFKKGDFLKWIKLHADQIPQDVIDNVKTLKIKMATNVSEDIIDEDSERTVSDVIQSTNVPKKFTLNLPLTENIRADIDFECEVVQLKDQYGRPANKRGIQLRCTNAREVKQDMMRGILAMLPEHLPKYYGKVSSRLPKNPWD